MAKKSNQRPSNSPQRPKGETQAAAGKKNRTDSAVSINVSNHQQHDKCIKNKDAGFLERFLDKFLNLLRFKPKNQQEVNVDALPEQSNMEPAKQIDDVEADSTCNASVNVEDTDNIQSASTKEESKVNNSLVDVVELSLEEATTDPVGAFDTHIEIVNHIQEFMKNTNVKGFTTEGKTPSEIVKDFFDYVNKLYADVEEGKGNLIASEENAKKQCSDLNDEIIRWKSDFKRLKEENTEQSSIIIDRNRDIRGLKDTIIDLERRLKAAPSNETFTELNKKLSKATESHRSIEEELRKTKADLHNEHEELEKVNAQLKNAQTALNDSQNQVAAQKEKLSALECSEVGQIQLKLDETIKELNNSNACIDTIKRDNNVLKDELTKISSEKSDVLARLSDVNGKLAEAEASNSQLLAENKSILSDKDRIEKDLSRKLEDAKKEADDMCQKLERDFKNELENVKIDADTKFQLLKKEKDEAEIKAQSELSSLNYALQTSKIKYDEKEVELSLTRDEIDQLKGNVKKLQDELKDANSAIDGLKAEITHNKESITNLNNTLAHTKEIVANCVKETATSVKAYLDQLTQLLTDGGYEKGVGEMAETCAEDETANRSMLQKLCGKIEAIDLSSIKDTAEYLDKVESVLREDIINGGAGLFLPLVRLCSYARIPFMRDDRGDDHMTLDASKLAKIESAIKGLFALVDISFITPLPFVDKLSEGDFVNAEGSVPNLEYICPNVRSRLNGVDRVNKSDIITDIVLVGYRFGRVEKMEVKAKVLI